MALTTLVCYDISRDAVRARVAGYLQHWALRFGAVAISAAYKSNRGPASARLTLGRSGV